MFELLGICLSLSGLLVINSLGSLAAALIWRFSSRAAESWPASARAQFLFVLRVFPPVAAVLCVGMLFLPSFLAHEPRQTAEVVTAKLGLLAAASLYAIGCALWRGLAAWRMTQRLKRDWLLRSERIHLDDIPVPTFRIPHPFPLIAVVGIFRPRMFIADQVFQSLTPAELSAALAHEHGHVIAADNLRRGLLRICHNLMPVKFLGRALDRAWIGTAELAADEHAARSGALVALDLASALVKVARLVPRDTRPAMFAGAFLIAQEIGCVRRRVVRLTQLALIGGDLKPERHVSIGRMGACAFGFFLAVSFVVSISGLSTTIHSALEWVVSMLQ
jgi:Zn-dependent protease with chaperone function